MKALSLHVVILHLWANAALVWSQILTLQMRTLRSETTYGNWKPFDNDEECFLFHRKSSFCSEDIEIFILPFLVRQENGLLGKLRLISKFMTSQTRKQLLYTYYLISQEVKVTRRWKLNNESWSVNRIQHENILKFHIVCFYFMSTQRAIEI